MEITHQHVDSMSHQSVRIDKNGEKKRKKKQTEVNKIVNYFVFATNNEQKLIRSPSETSQVSDVEWSRASQPVTHTHMHYTMSLEPEPIPTDL